MNPTEQKDKFEELLGNIGAWDQLDTFAFMFYQCSKFGGRNVSLDLEHGKLEVYSNESTSDDESATKVDESYDITYTLKKL